MKIGAASFASRFFMLSCCILCVTLFPFLFGVQSYSKNIEKRIDICQEYTIRLQLFKRVREVVISVP